MGLGIEVKQYGSLRTTTVNAQFGAPISSAGAALSAFGLSFGGDDHNVQTISAEITQVAPETDTVAIGQSVLMHDNSGNNAFAAMSSIVITTLASE